jgi:hypothetical protein
MTNNMNYVIALGSRLFQTDESNVKSLKDISNAFHKPTTLVEYVNAAKDVLKATEIKIFYEGIGKIISQEPVLTFLATSGSAQIPIDIYDVNDGVGVKNEKTKS